VRNPFTRIVIPNPCVDDVSRTVPFFPIVLPALTKRIALFTINSTVSTPVNVPSLPDDVAQDFMKKRFPVAWRFDENGREIPTIGADALDILDALSADRRRQVFIAKSYDREFNYEELEFLGDAALKHSISRLIEQRYKDVTMAWRHVSLYAILGSA
jgi:dsRNA-specific ribonuclease